jgi:hypothetical protein
VFENSVIWGLVLAFRARSTGPVTLNPDEAFHFKLRRCAFDAAQGTSG